jgi:hypothetical protein
VRSVVDAGDVPCELEHDVLEPTAGPQHGDIVFAGPADGVERARGALVRAAGSDDDAVERCEHVAGAVAGEPGSAEPRHPTLDAERVGRVRQRGRGRDMGFVVLLVVADHTDLHDGGSVTVPSLR